MKKKEWVEEFEDEIQLIQKNVLSFKNGVSCSIIDFLDYYLGTNKESLFFRGIKVKIKACNGCIQIEGIK